MSKHHYAPKIIKVSASQIKIPTLTFACDVSQYPEQTAFFRSLNNSQVSSVCPNLCIVSGEKNIECKHAIEEENETNSPACG